MCAVFVHYLCNTGSSESHYDSHYIDSKLKLQEFRDAVVDIPPPHDCLHNAREIIVSQDDIRGLFSYISPSYALRKRVSERDNGRKWETVRKTQNTERERAIILRPLTKFVWTFCAWNAPPNIV